MLDTHYFHIRRLDIEKIYAIYTITSNEILKRDMNRKMHGQLSKRCDNFDFLLLYLILPLPEMWKKSQQFFLKNENSIDLDWKLVAQVSVAVATNSDSVGDNSDSNWFTPLTVRWKQIQFQFWLFIDWTTIIKRKQTDVSNILNAKISINGRAILEKCSIKCDFVLL